MVGRPAQQPKACLRDSRMSPESLLQIPPSAGHEEVGAVGRTNAVVDNHVSARRRIEFEIEDAGNRLRGSAKARVPDDVVDALRADVDASAVAQPCEILASRSHRDLGTPWWSEVLRRPERLGQNSTPGTSLPPRRRSRRNPSFGILINRAPRRPASTTES